MRAPAACTGACSQLCHIKCRFARSPIIDEVYSSQLGSIEPSLLQRSRDCMVHWSKPAASCIRSNVMISELVSTLQASDDMHWPPVMIEASGPSAAADWPIRQASCFGRRALYRLEV